ncbi:MAG: CHAT domain-containing protein [Elusimicrobia bacterium]|nr:CHAT domain-containing protein [Elusimicrobiota bacterium]
MNSSVLPVLALGAVLCGCGGVKVSARHKDARRLYQAGAVLEAEKAFAGSVDEAKTRFDAVAWTESLAELAWMKAELGLQGEAVRLMREAIDVGRRNGLSVSIFMARLGALQARMGQYEAGLASAEQALDEAAAGRRALRPGSAQEGRAAVIDEAMRRPGWPPDVPMIKAVTAAEGALTTIHYLRGDFAKVLEIGPTALRHFQDIAGLIRLASADEKRSFHEGWGLTTLAVADSSLRTGDIGRARELFAQARERFNKARYRFGDMVAEGLDALSYAFQGDYAAASRLAKPAFERITASGVDEIIWRMRYEFAAVLWKESRAFGLAVEGLEKAGQPGEVAAFRDSWIKQRDLRGLHLLQLLDDRRAGELRASMDRFAAVTAKDEAVLEGRKLAGVLGDIAYDSILSSVGSIESLRGLLETDLNKRMFLGDKGRVYDLAVLIALELKGPEEALVMAERARARALVDLFAGEALRFGSPELRDKESALRRALKEDYARASRLRQASRQGGRAGASEGLASLEEAVARGEGRYRDLIVTLRQSVPETVSLISPEPLDAKTLLSLIPDGAGLLYYYVAGDRAVVWTRGPGGLSAAVVPLPKDGASSLVEGYRKAVLARDSGGEPRLARELHGLLVAPFEAALQPGKKVLVVPHAGLHYLPFAALLSDAGRLGARFSLRYAPSLTALSYLARRDLQGSPGIVVVGNPDLGIRSYDLPNAEAEARQVAAGYGGAALFLGTAATKAAVRERLPGAGILHVAAHAAYDNREPMNSGLYLAAASPAAGLWTASEITGERLPLRLAVLSACQTAVGAAGSGDEVVGLNRALAYAGVGTVVSSLWSVEDRSTAKLMAAFHEGLRSGGSPAAALREAQASLMKDPAFDQPFFWAAFGVYGLDR